MGETKRVLPLTSKEKITYHSPRHTLLLLNETK